jgi:hypothetical protein
MSDMVLPTDVFDKLLSRLMGLPNGGHTQPTVVQAIDFYGNTTSYMVQTVRTEEGPTAFVTQVNAAGSVRYILPASVLKLVDRQRDAITVQIRKRHGKRLAEERAANGVVTVFTPEMRAKALETRKAKAAKRRARKAVR